MTDNVRIKAQLNHQEVEATSTASTSAQIHWTEFEAYAEKHPGVLVDYDAAETFRHTTLEEWAAEEVIGYVPFEMWAKDFRGNAPTEVRAWLPEELEIWADGHAETVVDNLFDNELNDQLPEECIDNITRSMRTEAVKLITRALQPAIEEAVKDWPKPYRRGAKIILDEGFWLSFEEVGGEG